MIFVDVYLMMIIINRSDDGDDDGLHNIVFVDLYSEAFIFLLLLIVSYGTALTVNK